MNITSKTKIYWIIAAVVATVAIVATCVAVGISRSNDGTDTDSDTNADAGTNDPISDTDENTTGNDTDNESTADDTTGEDTTGEDTTGEDSTGEDTTDGDTDEDTTADDTTNEGTTADDTTADDTTDVADCTHMWGAATCEKPKTCEHCGETSGSALGHDWTDATCIKAKTCSVCGKTSGEKLGHNYTKATCAKPETCTRCGNTQGVPSNHDFVNGTCKNCGAKQSDYIDTDITVVNPVTGETMTVEDVLALLPAEKNKAGMIHAFTGERITVINMEVTQNGGIKISFSDGTGTSIGKCAYCNNLPCPDGGGENCKEYDTAKDPTKSCPECGRPYGDGYNGTCYSTIDWDAGGIIICHHYD